MSKLYCVPLGHSPRSLFYEKLQSVGYDKGVLVLPSRILMHQAQREANVRTIDIDFLATTILSDNGYMGLRQINRRTQELVIKDLIKFLAQRDKLEYFGGLAEKPGFVKALTSLISQLSRSGATEAEIMEQFRDWGRTGNQGQKDREISQLYALYRKYLQDNGWFDLEGKYRLAIKVLQEEKVKLRWQVVCLSDFYTFDALQVEFIHALSKRTDVSIGLMYEAVQHNEVFKAIERTYNDLMKFCDLEKLKLESSAAPKQVRICEFKERQSEMAWVLTEVKQLLRKGVSPKDILVAFRKFDNYSGLRNLADAYGIPVSIPQSSALNLQPLTELLLLLLEAKPDNRQGAEAYFKILGCGLTRLIFAVPGEQAQGWREEKYFTTRSQVQAKCREYFIEENSLIILDDALDRLPTIATVAEYSALLEGFLESLNIERRAGEWYKEGLLDFTAVKGYLKSKQLILQCLQSLREDYKSCDLHEEKLSLQDFAAAFREGLQDYQVNLVEGRSDGVLITDVINAQGLDFKFIYLLGLREGEFPAGSSENWIYNDKERGELAVHGIDMPNSALAYTEDAYFFGATVAQAKESLVLTYHQDDQARASAYIAEAQKTYGIKAETICTKEPACLAEAFAPGAKLSPEWLGKHLPEAVTISASIDAARSGENGSIFRGVLADEQLLQEVRSFVGTTFSPSALELYAKCPFSFLGGRVWKLNAFQEKEELAAPADKGSLLHATLAKFIGKHLREKLPKYDYSLLWEELCKDFQEVCAALIVKGELEENELWRAEQASLLKTLRRWLRYEYDLQKQWDFTPCAVEWDFSSKNGKPLRLRLKDGTSYTIAGRIDRIDGNGDKVFVTDYKLSSTPAGSDLPNGIDLQMPVYLLAASKLYGKEVVGGGYLSLKAGKRESTVKLAALELPFNQKSRDYFADAEDKWETFKNFSEKLLAEYVEGIYAGNFKVQPKKKCSPYCPLKEICRLSINQQGGEADE